MNQVIEGKQHATVGEQLPYTITCLGSGDVTSPVCTVYHNKTDVTTLAMPDGGSSGSASGNVITLPKFYALDKYIGENLISVSYTRNSGVLIGEIRVIVKKAEV